MKHSTYILARKALVQRLFDLEDDFQYLKFNIQTLERRCDPDKPESMDDFIKMNQIKTQKRVVSQKIGRVTAAMRDLKKAQKEPLLKMYRTQTCSLLKG